MQSITISFSAISKFPILATRANRNGSRPIGQTYVHFEHLIQGLSGFRLLSFSCISKIPEEPLTTGISKDVSALPIIGPPLITFPVSSGKPPDASIIAEICSVSNMYFPCPITEYLTANMPGAELVYDKLLSEANLTKEKIDAFFSCANSSIDIDAWEDEAIFSYFGKDLPVTAFSSFIGETSDASMLHLIAACVCLKDNFLPPVLGYSGNPEMQSNILQEKKYFDRLKNIIISRLGLGGSYSTVLLTSPRN